MHCFVSSPVQLGCHSRTICGGGKWQGLRPCCKKLSHSFLVSILLLSKLPAEQLAAERTSLLSRYKGRAAGMPIQYALQTVTLCSCIGFKSADLAGEGYDSLMSSSWKGTEKLVHDWRLEVKAAALTGVAYRFSRKVPDSFAYFFAFLWLVGAIRSSHTRQ